MVGELGIPNDRPAAEQSDWNALMDISLEFLGCYDVDWFGWAGGKWWGDYVLEIYDYQNGTQTPTPNAAPYENNYGNTAKTGINWSGYEFANAPEVWQDYTSAVSDFTYLAGRGVNTIRLPVHWCDATDGVQCGPIKPAWSAMICGLLDAAQSAGIEVILDIHEYGAYCADDPFLTCDRPLSDPAVLNCYLDFLDKLFAIQCGNTTFGNHPALCGFDIMNEPACVSVSDWEGVSTQIVNHIRNNIGHSGKLYVPTGFYSGLTNLNQHSGQWINDSNFCYTMHHYFDQTGGTYNNLSYDQHNQNAINQGYSAGDTYTFMKPC